MARREAFRRAFLAAQRAGKTTFEYDGKLHPVETRDPDDPAPVEEPAVADIKSIQNSELHAFDGTGYIDYFSVATLPYNTDPDINAS